MDRLSVDVWRYIFEFAVDNNYDWSRIRVSSKSFQNAVDDKNVLKNMLTYVDYCGAQHPDVVIHHPEYFKNIVAGYRFNCAMFSGFTHMTSLHICDINHTSTLIPTERLRNLTHFNMSKCVYYTGGDIITTVARYLIGCTHINLSDTLFHNVGVFARMQCLTDLDISGTDVSYISDLPPNLKTLTARFLRPLTLSAVSESLTTLNISECTVVSNIQCYKSFPNLEVLIANSTIYTWGNICDNPFGVKINTIYAHGTSMTDYTISNICSTKSLSALYIGMCYLSNNSVTRLSKCVQLDTLWFGYDEMNSIYLHYYHGDVTLTKVWLGNHRIRLLIK